MPQPMPVNEMPVFTVLTPHFSEKILLSLRELIREYDGDESGELTLLDYLKYLHPEEWENFVAESKLRQESYGTNTDDIALNAIGFRSNDERDILRTRIWASLRSQTLYVSRELVLLTTSARWRDS